MGYTVTWNGHEVLGVPEATLPACDFLLEVGADRPHRANVGDLVTADGYQGRVQEVVSDTELVIHVTDLADQ